MSNPSQNQNQSTNQKNQNPNNGQAQNPKSNPNRNGNEEFALRETSPSLGGRISGNDRLGTAFDLVERMHYLFVRVVKAKELSSNDVPNGYVEVNLGNYKGATNIVENKTNPEWNVVFTILNDRIQAAAVEVFVKDKEKGGDDFIGKVVFDLSEVPKRVPPDSPLAPQWYTLENKNGEKIKEGELMLAVWIGTQADEAFPEACHLDAAAVSGDGVTSIKSKVYLSPRLWYLRLNVIEAQELQLNDKNRQNPELFVRILLGNVSLKTKPSPTKNTAPMWNEDLMFAVAEPFEGHLVLTVENRVSANKEEVLGKCSIPLQNIEKRSDDKPPNSHWYVLEKQVQGDGDQKKVVKLSSRVHLRVCFDGGYHVLDELTQYSSDFQASARHLWKPSIGVLELGILSAQGLTGMKTKNGRGSSTTDAYCIAKYGQKWIRTRTILDNLNPKWNEQYTWEVFDPCTVITIGVFDNCHLQGVDKNGGPKDSKIGKVRIRLSTLETDRVYTHSYPLIVLTNSGVKKMGEIQLTVRFSCSSFLNLLQMYSKPLLPDMHYVHPLASYQIDSLRCQATQIVSLRLSRAEPPLRKEVVEYMLDVGSNMWSLRKSRANHCRIVAVLSDLLVFCRWIEKIKSWSSPPATILAHVSFLILIVFPRLIPSAIFISFLLIGISNYRLRPRHPPHMDTKLSQADRAHPDELDEEFDHFPTSKQGDSLKLRYDRLRNIGSRLQSFSADVAMQGERVHNLLSWRDPRATSLFMIFCLIAASVFYLAPFKLMIAVAGLYFLRHPRFRNRLPPLPVSFFKRLPSRTDSLL